MARHYSDRTNSTDLHGLAAEAAIFLLEASRDAHGIVRSYTFEQGEYPDPQLVATKIAPRPKPVWIGAAVSGHHLNITCGSIDDLDEQSRAVFEVTRYQRPPNWYSYSDSFLLLSDFKSLKLPLDVLTRLRQDYSISGYELSEFSAKDGNASLELSPQEGDGIGGVLRARPLPNVDIRRHAGGVDITIG